MFPNMGVKTLLISKSRNDQVVPEITHRIENELCGRKLGTWSITCSIQPRNFASSADTTCAKEIVSLSVNSPLKDDNKHLFILANNVLMSCDAAFVEVLERTSLFEKERHRIVIQGTACSLGDFVVSFGTILSSTQRCGVVLEIDYAPCVRVGGATKIFQDFIALLHLEGFETFIAKTPISTPPYEKPINESLRVQPADTARLYISLFQELGLLKAA